MRFPCLVAATLSIASSLGVVACSAPEASGEDEGATTLTGKERKLAFEGVVYVAPGTSPDDIVTRAEQQAQSAFGALRTSGIMAQTRELKNIDKATLKSREVRVVDPRRPTEAGEPMLEVRYTYTDEALVEAKLGARTSYALALLHPDWENGLECVDKEREARRDSRDGYLWYYFNPSLESCRLAIEAEQKAVDRDKERIAAAAPPEAPRGAPAVATPARIPKSQTTRRYYPMNVALEAVETNRGATYPEYDKLFRGGVEPNKLVIGLLVGRLEHHFVEAAKDGNYWEWMSSLDTIFQAQAGFELTKIEPDVDISKLEIPNRSFTGLKFSDYSGYALYDTFPSGLSAAEKKTLASAAGQKLDRRWLTFAKKVKVAIGNEAPRDFTIELRTFFGVETDLDVYKRAMKTSDVFVYNGHSFLGNGPLDPSNFQASDFPSSYQLWFLDGCITYNYYNNEYFPLKGGSKNLDLILNAFEAPADYGGEAEGKLLAKLISGKQPSYKQLLQAARKTDPLRVVEGETDNTFTPTATKIVVTR